MRKGLREPAKPFRAKLAGSSPAAGRSKPLPKRATNVSVDAEILKTAKEMGINLSQTLEDELRRLTKEAREAKWRDDNREAIQSRNRFIEKHGIWSKKYRTW